MQQPRVKNDYKTWLFINLLLVYLIWGSTYLGVKIAIKDLPPIWLTAVRFSIGGFVLLGISLFSQPFPSYSQIKGGFIIGFLLSGIGTSTVAYGIQFIPSGLVALIVALLPVWTFLLDYYFFSKIKPSFLSALGMVLGVVGILFLFNPIGTNAQTEKIAIYPLVFIIIGSISWAWGSLLSPKITQATNLQGTAIQMLGGGLSAAVFSMLLEKDQWSSLTQITAEGIWALVYLIVIGSFIGYTAFVWLINNAPPILTSTYAFVNPVVALLLGYFMGGEKLSNTTLIASTIILIGVISMTLGRRKKNFEE